MIGSLLIDEGALVKVIGARLVLKRALELCSRKRRPSCFRALPFPLCAHPFFLPQCRRSFFLFFLTQTIGKLAARFSIGAPPTRLRMKSHLLTRSPFRVNPCANFAPIRNE